jgi:two-component system response regulator
MAFREARIGNAVVRARNGVECLDYLFARGEYNQRDVTLLPAVVLLDLNLPLLGGIEVLKAIRVDARTRHLPVVVLTSSAEDKDRVAAYDNNANSYVQKPVDYDQFVKAANHLGLYWTVWNKPPPRAE